jgi:2-amino-4-hydroxy-6-hydroxymethyldihydropteridine diphosphokinase
MTSIDARRQGGTMPVVYLSLGSNLGDREARLRSAIGRLHGGETRVTAISSLYETEHAGHAPEPVPAYLNCALRAETSLTPEELLARSKRIEREGGRAETLGWMPRTIDIDLLLYDRETRATESLSLPHPRMFQRAFVLFPLIEIEPDLRWEGTSVKAIALRLREQALSVCPSANWPPELPPIQ